MLMDPFILARMQFAANITFHILFPTISIGLAWVLVFFKIKYQKTGDQKWLDAYSLWVKVFALTFALGVVSGITMSFQFGTNWPGFMETVGNIAGPLLGYEVMTAFFLEASFLGVMLYGRKMVSETVHTISTIIVASGTLFSAFWIIALNSWMQSPRGFVMIDGKAHVTSWLEVIFNPTMPYTLSHMLLACFITVAFVLAGVSSFQILWGNRSAAVKVVQKIGIYMAITLLPLQMLVGDLAGKNAHRNQPAKVAAIEGLWETAHGIPAIIFAIPDKETRTNKYEIGIPKLSSFLLTYDFNGKVLGLNEFKDAHPPVMQVFWAFRIMLGMGLLMLLSAAIGAWQIRSKGKTEKRITYLFFILSFSGWVSNVAGWYVAEIGRQPYLVYGVLKTKDAVADIAPNIVASTLITYLLVYLFLLCAYVGTIFYLANRASLKKIG